MKILAIHNNKMFFKKDAPNFYEWLCEQRGLSESYQELEKVYDKGENGPMVLSNTFCLAAAGLTFKEFSVYINDYIRKYRVEKIAEKLKKISENCIVMIFTSLPRLLFEDIFITVHKVFGAEPRVEENKNKTVFKKIVYLSDIDIADGGNKYAICDKFDELGLSSRYVHGIGEMGSLNAFAYELSIYPDRYGLLAYLIDQMIELKKGKENVIVAGKGRTAEPMHKVAGRVVESLENL